MVNGIIEYKKLHHFIEFIGVHKEWEFRENQASIIKSISNTKGIISFIEASAV